MRLELADGSTCLASPVGEFEVTENAEIVIRAQKMTLGNKEDFIREEGMNYFFGTIKDRSYMGERSVISWKLPTVSCCM
ncbi:MAG: hypothetical protein U5K27_15285 [Desulfotignum sp.]|nr:hypothetical protein [Desulfotignum sp.]